MRANVGMVGDGISPCLVTADVGCHQHWYRWAMESAI